MTDEDSTWSLIKRSREYRRIYHVQAADSRDRPITYDPHYAWVETSISAGKITLLVKNR